VANRLEQTAALFIGVPAILAIVVVFGVSPRSATGVACKAVTVGLLLSLLFLWEGMLCVLMSAPLFYAVAIAVASVMTRLGAGDEGPTFTLRCCLALLMLAPMSLEGVTGRTSVNRDETVVVSRMVAAPADAVETALLQPPRFTRSLPLYLRAGFPAPAGVRVERAAGSLQWVVHLRGGEMRVNGTEPRTGDLILRLAERRPGMARWIAVSDTSHMTHFLVWRESVVEWQRIDAHTTNVTWTLRYRRGLDPAWYFGPMQRIAARLAAGYLIDAVATP
jgi:hypothetical protein